LAKKTRPQNVPSIVNRDGTIDVVRIGMKRRPLSDMYHQLIGASWPHFLGAMMVFYLISNSLFATLYWLNPGGIENARPGSWGDAYAFSVQTMATIGYGKMAPVSAFCHLVVTFESMFGMMTTAVTTGLVFSKFARPTARILFSRVAVITIRDGVRSLVFRVANERGNQVVEAQLRLWLFRTERTIEGEQIRRFYELPLTRSQSPVFALTWTATHVISPDSLLAGATKESLGEGNVELVVSVLGIDTTLAQSVHARYGYRTKDILFGHRFVDILGVDEDGRRVINYHAFHHTVPMPDHPVDDGKPPSPSATV
jgi:inward rectifier potassium channel